MGGALKMRLDEKDAMSEWMGGAPPPGPLEEISDAWHLTRYQIVQFSRGSHTRGLGYGAAGWIPR